MIKELIKLADHLDRKGFCREAKYVDWIIKRSRQSFEGTEVDPPVEIAKRLDEMFAL